MAMLAQAEASSPHVKMGGSQRIEDVLAGRCRRAGR